ncbi:MAG: hypothetical protein DRI89_11625 [Bacteroidetes bacterium]|nr:MAG: hypothetical protein DRI89_11625 [Bacteroidota bacterium]
MKKITFILILIFAFSAGIIAQDYIYFADQQNRIAAKNVKISSSEIRYENYESNEGQIYIINRARVSLVAYEDGTTKYLQGREKKKSNYEYNKNLISFHLTDLIISNFTLSYERILGNGNTSIQIPVSFGYSSNNNFGDYYIYNTFYSGLNFNFYPTGQGKVRYFLGPGVRIGIGHDSGYSNDGYDKVESSDSFYTKLLINNGIIFSPIPELSLSAVLSLGMRYFPEAGKYNDEVRTTGAFSFNLSYRF